MSSAEPQYWTDALGRMVPLPAPSPHHLTLEQLAQRMGFQGQDSLSPTWQMVVNICNAQITTAHQQGRAEGLRAGVRVAEAKLEEYSSAWDTASQESQFDTQWAEAKETAAQQIRDGITALLRADEAQDTKPKENTPMTELNPAQWPTLRTLAIPHYRKPRQITHRADFGNGPEITGIFPEELTWDAELTQKHLLMGCCYNVQTADGHQFPALIEAWESGGDSTNDRVRLRDLTPAQRD